MYERAIELQRAIRAPRERVWEELTRRGRLQEWLCNEATIDARPGGRYHLRWRSGFEAQGSLVRFDPPQGLAMAWIGSGEPGATLVEWALQADGDSTQVSLRHDGWGSDPRSQAARAEAAEAWPRGLENLASVLEEGLDLREVRRPLLGVLLDNLTAERAAKEGIATTSGVYVADAVEGGAAAGAGVQTGDVIVGLGALDVPDYGGLVAAMQAVRAGDTVEVRLVRGAQRLAVQATLQSRPRPPEPGTLAEAVARLREAQSKVREDLAQSTAGLDDVRAGQAPAEGEWSVREVLAHLSGTERDLHTHLVQLVVGFERVGEPDFALAPDRNAVILAVEPTLGGMLARFDRDLEETALLVAGLAPATQADRYRYRQALELVFNFLQHTTDHLEQIRRAAEAVRGA
jgi:uncharacterized protein YndB with AHSA1/START domain